MVEAGPKTAFVHQRVRLEKPRLLLLTGSRKGEEVTLDLDRRITTVGSDPDCNLVIEGLASVHVALELEADRSGIRLEDKSGGKTRVNGRIVHTAVLEPGATLDLDGTEMRFSDGGDGATVLPSTADHFGPAKGTSLAMREVFGMVEAISGTTATLLLTGETGTGKDVISNAVHAASPRGDRDILTLDCGAIAPSLIEAELFGYERGAFTGADETRPGAFERAHGGTLFLDEIGELPLDVQPKLLRALEDREVRRVGGSETFAVDVRIIAATKRNLNEEVAAGRFRQDLYFRLAVVEVRMPALRERRDDIPLLVETFAAAFEQRTGHKAEIEREEVNRLLAHDWPGNVRELKNTVERALWLAATGDGIARFMLPTADSLFLDDVPSDAPTATPTFDPERSFSEHKQGWERDFERSFLGWLMARADGSISKAARLASMDRKHLRGLLRKHGLWRSPD